MSSFRLFGAGLLLWLSFPAFTFAQNPGCAQLVEARDSRAGQVCAASCASGNNVADCRELGQAFLFGFGMAPDYDKALRYLKPACEKSDAHACHFLAIMHHRGQGVARDMTLAANHYSLACNGSVPEACFNLAYLHQTGEGVAQSGDEAERLYASACDRVPEACHNLANMYLHGGGIAANPQQAESYYSNGCRQNFAQSCFNLGAMYATGALGAVNRVRAFRFFRQACAAGNSDACTRAAEMQPNAAPDRPTPTLALFIDVHNDGAYVACTEYYIDGTPAELASATDKLWQNVASIVRPGGAREELNCVAFAEKSFAVCRQAVSGRRPIQSAQNQFERQVRAVFGTAIESYSIVTYYLAWPESPEATCIGGEYSPMQRSTSNPVSPPTAPGAPN